MTTKYEKELLVEAMEVVKSVASDLIDSADQSVMGHAFLWATVRVGNVKSRFIAGYGACADWSAVDSKLRKACPQVVSTTLNMD